MSAPSPPLPDPHSVPPVNPTSNSGAGADPSSVTPILLNDTAASSTPVPKLSHAPTSAAEDTQSPEHQITAAPSIKGSERRNEQRDAAPVADSWQNQGSSKTEVSPQGGATASDASPNIDTQPEADTTEQANQSDVVVLRTLSTLIREYGARGFTHWQRSEHGELFAAPVKEGELDSETQEKAKQLVQECLERSQVTYKIFSSRARQFIVAAPVPAVDGYAISICFPFNRESDATPDVNQKANIHLRCRDVAITAAHLSIVRLQSDNLALKNEAKHSADEIEPNSAIELSKQAAKAAALGFANYCRNPKQLLIVAGVILLLGLVPFPHTVSCNVTCEPAVRRYVAAPYDSKLLEAKVLPGDEVKKGQLLALLDGSDLRSQIAGLQAELSQASQRRAGALNTNNASEAELERLEIKKLRGEIDLLTTRKNNLEIRSPVSGVVVSGNLERQKGVPLSMGENLFEIAPLNDLVAEVAVPESEISFVTSGQKCRISLDSGQGASHRTTLERIHPRNEMRESESVFVAEANISNEETDIRPGMTGTARISTGFKPIGWILFHKPFEVARQWIGW